MTGRGLDQALAAESVAVLADVHGNAVALEAVAQEILAIGPDAVVFLGDLTCGPLPEETWRAVRGFCSRFEGAARFVRGNTERAMIEAATRLRDGSGELTARERWLIDAHAPATRQAIEAFEPAVILDVAGFGAVRFCHGSPRSDEEMITSATTGARMQALIAGVDERVLVSAHTHIQLWRCCSPLPHPRRSSHTRKHSSTPANPVQRCAYSPAHEPPATSGGSGAKRRSSRRRCDPQLRGPTSTVSLRTSAVRIASVRGSPKNESLAMTRSGWRFFR